LANGVSLSFLRDEEASGSLFSFEKSSITELFHAILSPSEDAGKKRFPSFSLFP